MKRHLAASFIVTVGVSAVGCHPREPIHYNPPPPEPTPTNVLVEPENTADPKWTDPPDPNASLPEAPAGVEVQKGEDGVCFYYANEAPMHCPEGASCNPPPPVHVKVKCPPGK